LILAQTDWLALSIKLQKDNFFHGIKKIWYDFDFPTLPRDHIIFDLKNQGVLGKWKIVDLFIVEFISCRIKQYNYTSACSTCMKEFDPTCWQCNSNTCKKL